MLSIVDGMIYGLSSYFIFKKEFLGVFNYLSGFIDLKLEVANKGLDFIVKTSLLNGYEWQILLWVCLSYVLAFGCVNV